MKTIIRKYKHLLFFSLMILFISCKKENHYIEATVETNCGGLFVKIEDKLLYVCNGEKLLNFESGQKIKIALKMTSNCYPKGISCAMYSYDKAIEIIDVKKQ